MVGERWNVVEVLLRLALSVKISRILEQQDGAVVCVCPGRPLSVLNVALAGTPLQGT